MKTSLILTVYNEEKGIDKLIDSLVKQLKLPSEIIIVDAFSKDNTYEKLLHFQKKNKSLNIKILRNKGNISTGRNLAIKNTVNEIILCTDGDCILDKNWVKSISDKFKDKRINVVSGYYEPIAKNIFEKCLSTYTCVMPDKINEENYLPSSRSIAFRKSAWKKVGGYPEFLDRGEDLFFAKKLKEKGLNFIFVKSAVVYWPQRKNFHEAFKQFFGYAKGDGQALNIRNEVLLVYLRYFIGCYLIFISILERSRIGLLFIGVLFLLYVLWSIKKNYHYVRHKKALIILPFLQFIADVAVLFGTILGLLQRITLKKIKNFVLANKFLITLLGVYILILLLTIKWGAPSSINPYPYNMDEWHQFQAVRTTVAHGTPNVLGSANGTMFHFILSAIYLAPFTLIKYINPINLPVNDLVMRERIFDLLRINTIIYGSFSICVLYAITKKLQINSAIVISFFVFTPIWITLSGFFKYDIALTFWILLSIYFLIGFVEEQTSKKFMLCSIMCAVAFSVKVSAIPLLPILFISFFMFYAKPFQNIKILFFGFLISVITIVMLGVPDTIFGKGNIILFLKENIVGFPSTVDNFNLGMNPVFYLYTKIYPIIFGHGLYLLYFNSFILVILLIFKYGIKSSINNHKLEIFIIISSFTFIISLLPLNLYAGGNKSLVLLPFMVLIIGLGWKKAKYDINLKRFFLVLIVMTLTLNIFETSLWINTKRYDSPQVESSKWVIKNIPKNSEIGLENIPIYQSIPDILKKEYYFKQDNFGVGNLYKYSIIDAQSKNLPNIIVVTNGQIDSLLYKKSPKKDLLKRLNREGYEIGYVLHARKPYNLSEKEFNLSWILAVPDTVAVYIKN